MKISASLFYLMHRILTHMTLLVLPLLVAVVSAGTAEALTTNDLVKAASYDGDLTRVKALLAAKVDVNVRASEGSTALMTASNQGYREVVELLEQVGATE